MGCLLIIGDNVPTLQDTCGALRQSGIEVDVCTSLVDAFATAMRESYSAIVLDCRDGSDASLYCLRLRQQGCASSIVVVIPSEREDDQLRLFEAGADDVISGPVSDRLLIARIKVHVRRLGQAPQSGVAAIARREAQEEVETSELVAGAELTRIEGRLFTCLRATLGTPVTMDALYKAGWPSNQRVMPQTLYVHLSTLRKKLAASGWSLHRVGRGGYYLSSLPARSEPSDGTG